MGAFPIGLIINFVIFVILECVFEHVYQKQEEESKYTSKVNITTAIEFCRSILALTFFVGLFVGVYALGINSGLNSASLNSYTDYYEPNAVVETRGIISADLNNTIKGEFVIGCGHIDGEDVYRVYVETEPSEYKLISIPADMTTIDESDTVACVKSFKANRYKVLSDFGKSVFGTDTVFGTNLILYKYKLCVPKGSIRKNFNNLNL